MKIVCSDKSAMTGLISVDFTKALNNECNRSGMSIISSLASIDFATLENHVLGAQVALQELGEAVPKSKKKPFYQTLYKHPKFVRK